LKRNILILLFIALALGAGAQEQLNNVAKQYLLAGNYEKAAATYKQLLDYSPKDKTLQQAYLESLMGMKDYKNAEKVAKTLLKANPEDARINFQLVKIYKGINEEKKANKLVEKIIARTNNNDEEIRATASMFEKDDYLDNAIAVYERGKSYQKENPYLYAEQLALLYNKKGDVEKATESLLDTYVSRQDKSEEIKATFQRIMNNPEKLKELQAKIFKRIEKQPEIMAYPDLMAWMFIQQKDYEKAFVQIKSIDLKNNESGRRMIGFARVCFRELQFKTAIIAYNAVIDLGKEYEFYLLARSEKLSCMKEELQRNPLYTQENVKLLGLEYASFLDDFPQYLQKETIREYAELEARYAHNIDRAIELLSNVVKANNVPQAFRGRCKLEMGDYELVRNNIWESTLLYSQVDKDFKQDILGEEARFRNAKLSYYAGDFTWSQGQLDVLKSSTSELIANDALNLSVLITENNPPADSNATPLMMFAKADLLEFQNKDEEALTLLDSIATEYPKHPLQDNILMARAHIATKKQDYNETAMLLQKVVTNYGDDILADDALYNLAVINEVFFKNVDEAKRLFEQLIIKYPGSSFVNEARKSFRRLRGDRADVEDGGS
jgi:TolA-binding protein